MTFWPAISTANFLTGFLLGVASNPLELVYTRQISDDLLPKNARRNYSSVFDGLTQVINNRTYGRGSYANGISFGLVLAVATPTYDFLKEYYYDFFGPARWLRGTMLFASTLLASCFAVPFENLKVRLHVMTTLPDGRMPYDPNGVVNNLAKIAYFEGNYLKYSNLFCLYNGFTPFVIKYFTMLYCGLLLSDFAFEEIYKEGEFVDTGNFFKSSHVKNNLHEPYNRNATLQEVMEVKPSKVYFTNAKKNESFSI